MHLITQLPTHLGILKHMHTSFQLIHRMSIGDDDVERLVCDEAKSKEYRILRNMKLGRNYTTIYTSIRSLISPSYFSPNQSTLKTNL